jgi:hypothetical protein
MLTERADVTAEEVTSSTASSRYVVVRKSEWGSHGGTQFVPLEALEALGVSTDFLLDHYGPPRPCEACGRAVLSTWGRRRFRRVYCSAGCRAELAAAARRRPERACERCGELFARARSDARFCSGGCRVAAHRARRAAGDGGDFGPASSVTPPLPDRCAIAAGQPQNRL